MPEQPRPPHAARSLIAARTLASCFLIAALATTAHADPTPDDEPLNPKLVPPANLHEQVMHLSGDPDRPVDLIVTVYTPDGPGPFPLAVVNHGANGSKEKPADMARARYTYAAYYYLSRGYAVAMPMMRGYAGSGSRQENHHCELSDIALDNGRDIAGVITALGSDPQIDTSRVVVQGQSFGGWNTLGLGAVAPSGVRGLVNFVGGVHTSSCTETQGGNEDALIEGARRLGAATTLPSLWFYGENDSLFGPDVWRPMYQAYTQQGGHAQLVDVGRFMDDSHQLLSHMESFPIWVPQLDAFLARIGLPSKDIFPAYMPTALPPPTHFAAISDVNAVPWVSPASRESYRHFLDLKWPRVFLIAPGGEAATFSGNFDPMARALETCREHNLACRPYAVDDDVVWVPPPAVPRPPATHFADINDIDAVPWLTLQSRTMYANFLTKPSPRAFVIATTGAAAATQGGADPLGRAMSLCDQHSLVCRPYAVDNDVIWVQPPTSLPPRPTHFAALTNIAAVPWLNDKGRAAYAHFLTVPLPRAFAIAPGGQSAATQGGANPLARALSLCAHAGLACRAYAVDNEVVWVPGSR